MIPCPLIRQYALIPLSAHPVFLSLHLEFPAHPILSFIGQIVGGAGPAGETILLGLLLAHFGPLAHDTGGNGLQGALLFRLH